MTPLQVEALLFFISTYILHRFWYVCRFWLKEKNGA